MKNRATPELDPVMELALKRFQFTADSEFDNRKEMKSDTEFYVSDQWDSGIKNDRLQDNRPCLTINRLPQFTRQITNAMRQNPPSVRTIPVGDADEDVAEIFDGMMRHIQEASRASIAYCTAYEAQVRCGLGFYRILTEYVDDESFDQEIRIKRIKNPLSVYVDPAAIEPDYSDAMYMFVTEDMAIDDFKDMYPNKQVISNDTLLSKGDEVLGWAKKDSMRIAEYWTVEEKDHGMLYQLADGRIVKKLPKGVEAAKERPNKTRTVMFRKISGVEVLEEQEWPGKYIPIIPVLGEDIDVDGKRVIKGMVRDAKDPQRMLNYWSSCQTEMIALAPKSPFVGAEGQFEGYEDIWATANTKNHAFLTYNPKSIGGTVIGPPQRQTAEPAVQAMVEALQQAGQDLKDTTGVYDAQLGAKSNEVSGTAINARTRQGDVANYHFTDNFAQSQLHEGRILIDLIPKIYDTQRVVRILHPDGTSEQKTINGPSGEVDDQGVQKIYDITQGKYNVVVDTGPSYKTKRQEDAANMTQILQGNPELWQVAGDIFVKAMDWPDAQQLADRLKKALPPQLQDAEDGQQQLPPQVQQAMQKMQEQNQQLTQTVHKLMDEIEQKKVEMDAKAQMQREANESKERIAYSGNEVTLVTKAMGMQGDANHALLEAEFASIGKKEDAIHQMGVNAHANLLDINKLHADSVLNPNPQVDNGNNSDTVE